MADLTAGHLLATGVLAALVRARTVGEGQLVEVSLLGAALAVQIQDLVWLEGEAAGAAAAATRADLDGARRRDRRRPRDEPVLPLLRGGRRLPRGRLPQPGAAAGVPRRSSASTIRRSRRPTSFPTTRRCSREKQRADGARSSEAIAAEPVEAWLARLGAAGVPAGPVLARETVHADAQVRANGLLQDVEQPGLGPVTMLGAVFRIDGGGSGRDAPGAGARRRHRRRAARRWAREVHDRPRARAVRGVRARRARGLGGAARAGLRRVAGRPRRRARGAARGRRLGRALERPRRCSARRSRAGSSSGAPSRRSASSTRRRSARRSRSAAACGTARGGSRAASASRRSTAPARCAASQPRRCRRAGAAAGVGRRHARLPRRARRRRAREGGRARALPRAVRRAARRAAGRAGAARRCGARPRRPRPLRLGRGRAGRRLSGRDARLGGRRLPRGDRARPAGPRRHRLRARGRHPPLLPAREDACRCGSTRCCASSAAGRYESSRRSSGASTIFRIIASGTTVA